MAVTAVLQTTTPDVAARSAEATQALLRNERPAYIVNER
jgi:hypothetical protein